MMIMALGAVGALTLGALYQDDDRLDGVVVDGQVVGGDGGGRASASADGSSGGGIPAAGQGATVDDAPADGPIETFLPRSGEASACREDVGVDLIPGYGATLTINDIEIAPEEMNVNLDDNGEITRVITASRSLGHYTFHPSDECPNGPYLRPTDNVLEVCVYRLSDPAQRCTLRTERTFDAI